jgi:beta-hydroxylase
VNAPVPTTAAAETAWPPFFEPEAFPFTESLERNHEAIKRELLGVLGRRRWSRYLDHDERRGRALLFLLYVRGKPNRRNCRLCPTTAAVLAGIPDISQAVFGYLPAGAHIAPHRGAPGILRVHLGVVAEPFAAGWRVEGLARDCGEGKVTIFHDGSLHEAWNRGGAGRVTLICDPPAPAADPAQRRRAIEGYERRYGLPYLLRTLGRSRGPRHPYNRFVLPALLTTERWVRRLEPPLLAVALFFYNRVSARFRAGPPPHA